MVWTNSQEDTGKYIYKRIQVSVKFSSLVTLVGSHFEHGMVFPNN